MTSRADKAANLEQAERLVARAAATGADVVALPEKWNAIGSVEELHAAAEPLDGGESVAAMAEWARSHGITLVGGSISEKREGREKLSNTSLAFGPDGELLGVYRKIHLFDVEVGGHVYRESEAEEPGAEPVVVQGEGWPIGLTVCYDVRFPELYRISRSRAPSSSPCRRTSRHPPARTTGTCCCGRARSRTSTTSRLRRRSARRCRGSRRTAAR
jgi:predicted amidohydrolase